MAEHATIRLADLKRLYLQSKLIVAETYLEDREKLRLESSRLESASEEKRADLDRQLAALLEKAVIEVESAIKLSKQYNVRLDFRQSELLWELSSAKIILSQITADKKESKAADDLRRRSVAIAKNIAA